MDHKLIEIPRRRRRSVPIAMQVALLLALAACGGGGGGDDGDSADFEGEYLFQITRDLSTCPQTFPPTLTLDVSQDGSSVTVSDGRFTFAGSTSRSSSLFATTSGTIDCIDRSGDPIPGSTARYSGSLEFTGFDGDTADITYRLDVDDCTGDAIDSTCQFDLRGPAVRR